MFHSTFVGEDARVRRVWPVVRRQEALEGPHPDARGREAVQLPVLQAKVPQKRPAEEPPASQARRRCPGGREEDNLLVRKKKKMQRREISGEKILLEKE